MKTAASFAIVLASAVTPGPPQTVTATPVKALSVQELVRDANVVVIGEAVSDVEQGGERKVQNLQLP